MLLWRLNVPVQTLFAMHPVAVASCVSHKCEAGFEHESFQILVSAGSLKHCSEMSVFLFMEIFINLQLIESLFINILWREIKVISRTVNIFNQQPVK